MKSTTRIHTGTNRADLTAKEAERLRLQDDLEAFMAKGGKVEDVGQEHRPLLHPTMHQLNDATWDKRVAKAKE